MKKIAFTLAEVLLTLTIVGVISAITVPALVNSTEEKNLISRAQKAYNTLQNAITMKQALTGLTPEDVQNKNLLRSFLSVHNGNLVTQNGEAVLRNVWSSESGGGVIGFADGQVWAVPTTAAHVTTDFYCTQETPCYLQVDLNGVGGPNRNAPNQGWVDSNKHKLSFGSFNKSVFGLTEYNNKYRDMIYFEIAGLIAKPYTTHGVTRRYFNRK